MNTHLDLQATASDTEKALRCAVDADADTAQEIRIEDPNAEVSTACPSANDGVNTDSQNERTRPGREKEREAKEDVGEKGDDRLSLDLGPELELEPKSSCDGNGGRKDQLM
ncbi:hypothetical protein K505DRAFT_357125 [Melanomma pulvis-pyrius CBS 109.77]|uniref:Uncharacterized protein n=1 Tax=Melanomma pulvis-pyrius CBS 109.77 TaxID=1314802 RepID=A0A6A6XRL8_9PLEO|nr:hypothetical protein K505DRAFT_357125 [Melanomma pulvis-pyrius CBS 109.77]